MKLLKKYFILYKQYNTSRPSTQPRIKCVRPQLGEWQARLIFASKKMERIRTYRSQVGVNKHTCMYVQNIDIFNDIASAIRSTKLNLDCCQAFTVFDCVVLRANCARVLNNMLIALYLASILDPITIPHDCRPSQYYSTLIPSTNNRGLSLITFRCT